MKKNVVNSYNGILYGNENKVQLQARWMNLTNIGLRGKKDMKEHIHYDSICIKLLISKTKLYCVEKHKS